LLDLELFIGGFEQKMQNEPNLQNTQINVSYFMTKDYENKYPCGRRKNEPNTNPICTETSFTLHASRNTIKLTKFEKIGQFEQQNMQNEPNFKKAKIDVNFANKKNYENKRLAGQPKNEPNRTQFRPFLSQGIPWKNFGFEHLFLCRISRFVPGGYIFRRFTNFTCKLQMYPNKAYKLVFS
jgi:hypothetical protein